jgi:hypothetical protein
MVTLKLDDNQQQFNSLMAWRGRAIEQHAQLDMSLMVALAHLLATTTDLAAIVYYKIQNARSRLSILEALMRKRHGTTHKNFWESHLKIIKAVDQTRNEIVHWIARGDIEFREGTQSTTYCLAPAAGWATGSSEAKTISDLEEFCVKCDFLARLTNIFIGQISGQTTPRVEPWLSIFQQQSVYPPPSDHPLVQKPKG